MNTHESTAFERWDESELVVLVGAYVRLFRRLPSPTDVLRFEQARGSLRMRLAPRRVGTQRHLRAV